MMNYTLQQFLINYVESFKIYREGKIWKEKFLIPFCACGNVILF